MSENPYFCNYSLDLRNLNFLQKQSVHVSNEYIVFAD